MFEPVTITRSASVGGGAGPAPVGGGAAPMSVDSGGRFWANAFDAIMRRIPTQAASVMRRNPNLECPVLIMVSPFVRLGWTLRRVQAAPDVKPGFFLGSQTVVPNVKHKILCSEQCTRAMSRAMLRRTVAFACLKEWPSTFSTPVPKARP